LDLIHKCDEKEWFALQSGCKDLKENKNKKLMHAECLTQDLAPKNIKAA